MLSVPSIDKILYCASELAYDVDAKGNFNPYSRYPPHQNPYLNHLGSYHSITAFANSDGWLYDKINAAILIKSTSYNILAFRGTLSNFYKCATYQDWLSDLLAEPRDVTGYPGKVHTGIYDAYDTLKQEIFNALAQDKSKPLYITGHSKGGPMSTYAAYDAIRLGYTVKGVITFASPRPGDVDFANGYNSLLRQHNLRQVRYENDLDIVPLLPPEKGTVSDMVYTLSIIGAIVEVVDEPLGVAIEVLADSLQLAADWNYSPVGSLRYITKDHQIVLDSPSLWHTRLTQFENDFINTPTTAIQNIFKAHSLAIGGGYQKGVDPTI